MWRRLLRVVGFLLAVAIIVAYICYASHLAQEHRVGQSVNEIIISVLDSAETRQFTSSAHIRKILQESNIKLENVKIDSIDAVSISEKISQYGFIRDVEAYVTYSGKLYVDVEQHEPTLRLLCGGMNSYVTREYEIFRSPAHSACYAAIVTGNYTPRLPRSYEGNILDYYAAQIAKEDYKLGVLSNRLDSLKREERDCREKRNDLRKKSRKRRWEREERYKHRRVGVMLEMENCNNILAALSKSRESLKRGEEVVALRKKKLQKSCDDFTNLINFVSQIKSHQFWGAEVVQFVADTTTMGDISLRLVPRSGDFVVEFGTLDNSEAKLSKLQKFYDKGLSSIGWNEYKTIDVRYDKQVICTK